MFHTNTLEDVVQTLGGSRVLKDRSIRTFLDLDRIAHEGVPFAAFSRLVSIMDEPEVAVASGIGFARTTLNRRRGQGRFDLDESQRVLRLGVMLSMGAARTTIS